MKKKFFKRILVAAVCLALLGAMAPWAVNGHVKAVSKAQILTMEEASALQDVDCILVLGCQVRNDGSLSAMLRDRLQCGLELYRCGAAPKLLMSGDHGQTDYDEVHAMKRYAVENGVPSQNVFMDHAGFSTYESIYRAKEIFQAKKILIVTQEYHLYRALYIAEQFGVEAYGVSADFQRYAGQTNRDVREVLARCKDFALCLFKPKPTYLGSPIPIHGNGDVTND